MKQNPFTAHSVVIDFLVLPIYILVVDAEFQPFSAVCNSEMVPLYPMIPVSSIYSSTNVTLPLFSFRTYRYVTNHCSLYSMHTATYINLVGVFLFIFLKKNSNDKFVVIWKEYCTFVTEDCFLYWDFYCSTGFSIFETFIGRCFLWIGTVWRSH